jgi:hypothetical protein
MTQAYLKFFDQKCILFSVCCLWQPFLSIFVYQPTNCQLVANFVADMLINFYPNDFLVAIWHSLFAASANLSFLPAYYVSARHRWVTSL